MDRGNTRYATNIIDRSAGVFSVITVSTRNIWNTIYCILDGKHGNSDGTQWSDEVTLIRNHSVEMKSGM